MGRKREIERQRDRETERQRDRERERPPIMRSPIKDCNGCNDHGMHNRELTLKGKERAVTAAMECLTQFPSAPYTTPAPD